MSKFDNKLCPVCRSPFTENSEIVVCPECGTPHHRVCYLKNGKCGLEALHASGFVWKGFLPDEQPEPQPEPVNIDPHHAEYPAGVPTLPHIASDDDESGENYIRGFIEDMRRRTEDDSRGADGVSGRELTCFVGRSVFHYSQAFSLFRANNGENGSRVRICFNLCAGLFAPIHQFYRRMDGLGVAVMLITVITSLPQLLYVSGVADYSFVMPLQMLLNIVNFCLTVALCLFGDYLYYRYSVRRIKKIRSRFDDGKADGYYQALAESGSPSWLRAIIGMLAMLLITACITYFPSILAAAPV